MNGMKQKFDRLMLMEADGGAGGTGDGGTGGEGGTGGATGPSAAELQAELDALKAERAKDKQAITNLSAENAEKKRLLAEKMTAEEKAAEEMKSTQEEIDRLKQERESEKLENNKTMAETLLASVRADADVKDNDAEFTQLVTAITLPDREATKKLATYLSKIVKSAYDKGVAETKADDTKNTSSGVKTGGGKSERGSDADYKKFRENQVKLKDHVDL